MPAPSRDRSSLLADGYQRLTRRLGLPARDAQPLEPQHWTAPHPRLRLMLQSDPAMAALLPGMHGHFCLSAEPEPAPFYCAGDSLIQLSPALLEDAAALGAAARWGTEAAGLLRRHPAGTAPLDAVLRHGRGLLEGLQPASRALLLGLLPSDMAHWTEDQAPQSLRDWLVQQVEGLQSAPGSNAAPDALAQELAAPLETLLCQGGDSRLRLLPDTGLNSYGVPPRPRPEAIHFSSSTASAISDYGFLYAERLRRELLQAVDDNTASDAGDASLWLRRLADATGRELCLLLGLDEDGADLHLAASGTDTELVAVMLALAADAEVPLTNILISPQESGRGVALAAKGCYFDDATATGLKVSKGASAWPERRIQVAEIAVRDATGWVRSDEAMDADFVQAGAAALARGERVLAHVLWSSKTGLMAPSRAAVDQLVALAPQRVDVVIDTCQMRMGFQAMGECVQRGWMLQISGSKFLTGPPFSGALVLPLALRSRMDGVAQALRAAPAVCHADSWTAWWSERLPRTLGRASFGPLMRWLPALLEARLFAALPEDFRHQAFERIRGVIAARVVHSPWLAAVVSGMRHAEQDEVAHLSIVSFQVLGQSREGGVQALDELRCRRLFELLNLDCGALLPALDPMQRMLARQPVHIGQPVTLQAADGPVTALRVVIGARFFSIVGYAGPGAEEAALQSEISDAMRAIGKIELLASQWWRLEKS